MEVKIKRIDTTLPMPQYQTSGAVAFDIYSRENLSIAPKEIKLIPSNLIIETPPEYMLLLAARSSLAKRKGLALPNSVGIVDQDYCGENDEIMVQLYNFSDEVTTVERGERIAQGIFMPIQKAEWIEVEKMDSKNRGGFGSTGK